MVFPRENCKVYTCKNHSRSPDENCNRCIRGSNYIPYDVEFRSLIGQYNHYYPSTPTPQIKNVIFNPPATIVFWADGTKTVVKAHGEEFDPEKGLAMAIAKKALGTGYYPEIKKWTKDMKKKLEDDSIEDGSNSSVDIFDLARTYVRKKYGGD